MAHAAVVTMVVNRTRMPPVKRRMSRDIELPDVSNLPPDAVVHAGKMARRPNLDKLAANHSAPEKQKRVTFEVDSNAGQGRTSDPTARRGRTAMGENHSNIVTRSKAGNKPKAKATPCVAVGRKTRNAKREFKVEAPKPVTKSSPACRDEPMDVDNPALAIRSVLTRVPDSVNNIDDHMDPFLSPEYAQDIVNYMQARESQFVLPGDFLNKNPSVSSQMRAILMDWLILVQSHEQMEEETLQLAVRIIDQYLAKAEVQLPKLQLVGITGVLIAAKFIERFPPVTGTLCALTANTYVPEDVLEMEKDVLRVLKFDVSLPLPSFFLDRYLRVHAHDPRVEQLAAYLIDLSLPSVHMVSVAPSVLAASALYIARKVYQSDDQDTWTLALAFYTKYTDRDLASCAKLLARMLLRASVSKYQGARQKYSDIGLYGGISMDPLLDNHPGLLELTNDDIKNETLQVSMNESLPVNA